MKRALLVLVILYAQTANAGSVWQQIDDTPCPGMVIVDDTGDDHDGYIIPYNDNSKEVVYIEEPLDVAADSDDIDYDDLVDLDSAINDTPYD